MNFHLLDHLPGNRWYGTILGVTLLVSLFVLLVGSRVAFKSWLFGK